MIAPAPHPDDASRPAPDAPQPIRRLQRLAILLGLASILAAGLIGWSAYKVSRTTLVSVFREEVGGQARNLATFAASPGQPAISEERLEALRRYFETQVRTFERSYLCVMNDRGVLLMNTGDPSKVGAVVGDRPFGGIDPDGRQPRDMNEILDRNESWFGEFQSLDGHDQLAAFVPISSPRALVCVHVPKREVERSILASTLPWAVGFGITVFLAVPLALWGLSKAYTDTARAEHRAREAERRAAEKLRILREIDRAILAGGSTREIASTALAHLRDLVPCRRASVALLDEANQGSRILAIATDVESDLGPGTFVPYEVYGPGTMERLRSGEVEFLSGERSPASTKGFFEQLRQEGVRSLLKIPLVCRGDLIGTLNLSFEQETPPRAEDVEPAREVADVLALAVVQAQLHEELRLQKSELENRVAARTRELSEVNAELEGYVHSVSHDLRAPLRAVRGFANLLVEEMGPKLGATEREYVERIVSASGRMDTLMRDLLEYSRLSREDVRVRELDTSLVVQEARDLIQVELDETGARVEVDEPLLAVLGHHSSLVQSIANLLSNAAKFVETGRRPEIRVGTEARGDRVRIRIDDNGLGVPASDRERIFRVFERLNSPKAYSGSGLGLAIVRRAVERMGGSTGMEPLDEGREGRGSRFWIELPAGRSRK